MAKKKIDISKYNIDFNSTYLIPMLRIGNVTRKAKDAEIVNCTVSVSNDGNMIRATCDGYNNAYFYADYFNWLLYTKEIKKVI